MVSVFLCDNDCILRHNLACLIFLPRCFQKSASSTIQCLLHCNIQCIISSLNRFLLKKCFLECIILACNCAGNYFSIKTLPHLVLLRFFSDFLLKILEFAVARTNVYCYIKYYITCNEQ